MTERKTSRVTVYRDNSTSQVVYENVKHAFWTAGNTVFVISQYVDKTTNKHIYIHWLREHISWFKMEPMEVA